jgi:hypothetical protein
MMEIKGREIASVSFPDCAVLFWLVDADLHRVAIRTDGAFLDNGENRNFTRAEMSFTNWSSIGVRRFDVKSNNWERCSYDYDELKDICEFAVSEKEITVRGFGRRTGHWIELTIVGGIAAIKLM